MKKPPYNRPRAGPWRDAGDGSGRTPAPLVFRRRRASADDSDRLSKVAAAVFLVAVVLVVGANFREKKLLREDLRTAQAQEQARIVNDQVDMQHAELERQRVQFEQVAQSQRQLYRCVDRDGATSIQNAPCPATSSVTWAESVPVETPLEASLREQARNRQQAEARLRQVEAQFARATGAGNTSQTFYPTGASAASNGRCQSAKIQRDEAYRIAGNNRTFQMIRHWNDYVYEACKGV